MQLKPTLLSLCLLLLQWPVWAGTDPAKAELSGKVTETNGKPVEAVSVGIAAISRGTFTDREGMYQLKNIPPGSYLVSFSEVGYKTVKKEISLAAGEQLQLDMVLEPEVAELSAVFIEASPLSDRSTMPETEGAALYANKKTEVIALGRLDANLSMNVSRQVFAKVPGVMIWENDGSGVQTGVSTRGLSPNRSWEFNVRQNGYDISSDPFGYPEAYFNPPLEAVEQIQVVRGAASLQYGPQFGGLLNYVIKKPAPDKVLSGELSNTLGSFGMRNTFIGIGGSKGHWSYYGYANSRSAEGWRQNSRYNISNAYASVEYAASKKVSLGLELTAMDYRNQQPGGLSDSVFRLDARRSDRARNWFGTPWFVPVLKAKWAISEQQVLEVKAFGLLGERNSIGFVSAVTQPDSFNVSLGRFANRQIDRDRYANVGAEARYRSNFRLGAVRTTLAAGLRYSRGSTLRQQQGRGDAGSDFNLNLQEPQFRRELTFVNTDLAAFAEWHVRIGSRFSVTPGLRFENLSSSAEGRLGINSNGSEQKIEPLSRDRTFVLAGLGLGYQLSYSTSLYANFSQAYRPVLFSDLTPPATTDVIDPNLKDSDGYNLDAGVRGRLGNFLSFDLGAFLLRYDNRIGTIRQLGPGDSSSFQLRTNLGATESRGFEGYAELDVLGLLGRKMSGQLNVFASATLMEARYVGFRVNAVSGSAPNLSLTESDLKDKKVEYAPDHILRWGITYRLKGFSITLQQSSTGAVYADANNTELPNPAATTGKLAGYSLVDASVSYLLLERYRFTAGVNNLMDERYATRRAGGYPGPGLLPGEARNFYLGLSVQF